MIVGMTSSLSRRRLLSHAMAATGMGLLATGVATRAAAAPTSPVQAAQLLPAIGQTVNQSCNGFGATLVVNLPPPLPTLNAIGSRVFKVLIGGADFVRLQTLDFTMEALHPMFGKITMRLPDIDVSPATTLRLTAAGLVETWIQTMNITFERCGDLAGPFNFETIEPGKWIAHHTQFPPPVQGTNPDGSPTGGTLYRLQQPISYRLPGAARSPAPQTAPNPPASSCPLGAPLPGDPSGAYLQLQGFNVNQGQLRGPAD